VGEKEMEEGEVSIRKQGEGDQGSLKIDAFIKYFQDLIQA
ncbi:MAG: hypothetical protein KDC44_13895, partial [Phaeodactylibacter sp.]|nr:hypothetical protein [Phaeodactylibacter sp.]